MNGIVRYSIENGNRKGKALGMLFQDYMRKIFSASCTPQNQHNILLFTLNSNGFIQLVLIDFNFNSCNYKLQCNEAAARMLLDCNSKWR